MRSGEIVQRLRRLWRTIRSGVAGLGAAAAVLLLAVLAQEKLRSVLTQFGLHDPELGVAAAIAAALAAMGVALLVERATLSASVQEFVRIRDVDPLLIGVHEAARLTGDESVGPRVPRYISRHCDEDIDRALHNRRLVVVVGDELSGTSRAAWEGIRRNLPTRRTTLLLPLPPAGPGADVQSGGVARLLCETYPWRPLQRLVVWLDGAGPRWLSGEIDASALIDFLKRHHTALVVTTIRSAEYEALKGSAAGLELLGESRAIIGVRHELVEAELSDATSAFPAFDEADCRRLPEILAAHDQYVQRFRMADREERRAIVWAVVHWQRMGADHGTPLQWVRDALPDYLQPGQPVTDEDFQAAVRWLTEPFAGNRALLSFDGNRLAAHSTALIEEALRYRPLVPPRQWGALIGTVADDPAALERIARAAQHAGVLSAARGAWERLLEADRNGSGGQLAVQALIELANESVTDRVPDLQRVVGARTPAASLGSLSPGGVRPIGEAPGGDEGFDPRPAQRTSNFAQSLYRLRALRTLMRALVLVALDAVSLIAGLLSADAVRGLFRGDSRLIVDGEGGVLLVLTASIGIGALLLSGAYRGDAQRARVDRLAFATTLAACVTLPLGAAHGEGLVNSTVAWVSFAFAMPYLYALRAVYDRISRRWVRNNHLESRILILGPRASARDVGRRLRRSRQRPLKVIGYLTPEVAVPEKACLGTYGDLRRALRAHQITDVVIADELSSARTLAVLDDCRLSGTSHMDAGRTTGVQVARALTLEELQARGARVPFGQTLALERLVPTELSHASAVVKRTFDLGVGTTLLILIGPLLLLLMALVRLDRAGGAIIRPARPGRGDTSFGMYKLRTTDRDGQLTRIGGFLQQSQLDLLPQLLNVLDGSMSLVGPRPLPVEDYARMTGWHRRRYFVKPGVTGLEQLMRRSPAMDYDEIARLDLSYIAGWTVWRDVEILLRTVPTTLIRRVDRPSSDSTPRHLGG